MNARLDLPAQPEAKAQPARANWRRWMGRAPMGLALLLGGCSDTHIRLFDPVGTIARAEWRFTVIDVLIMLCIILPTLIFILIAMWRYRASRQAKYDPEFTHSVRLELLMWGIPLIAVIALGYFSWQGVFGVNPYNPTILNRKTSAANPPPGGAVAVHPLIINVVATDWQWLFIYPKQKIATLNTVYVPTGRTVEFRLTATDVVNDFYIPQLIGMIDVMPGMRTKDVMRVDHPGKWIGFSADISGAGMSWMQFPTHAVSAADFKTWVAKVKGGTSRLSYAAFEKLARPTVNITHHHAIYADVEPHLFRHVITAAMDGKTYRTPIFLTKDMLRNKRDHAGYLTAYASQKS
ncbi:ubiquinol oxidase subunit II [Acidiphilium acidophilum]|uniref:COX aromatic rich motif-containing protein n=1 Tax=Acidiphilium acidophilum TaxID=76588 RepID=A0AAW9DVI5_ACIAO|nr:COX aromatic rich motif-containing protein [Acidiphilium acidophilum]MDX5932886.1 COX aromatic rich motif-containing protein [Acidiphilium acidophilum]